MRHPKSRQQRKTQAELKVEALESYDEYKSGVEFLRERGLLRCANALQWKAMTSWLEFCAYQYAEDHQLTMEDYW